ncbi:MAG: ATP-binding protein, partial [Pseudomonadota bacterium]
MARNGLKTDLETDKPPVDNRARVRDFVVIVGGAVAILMLLAASSALGWVEAATAAIVVATGSGAYFVGSSQAEPSRPSLIDRPRRAGAREAINLAPIVNALPWPALHVGRDGRLDATNPAAQAIFRIQDAQNGLASAVLRSPVLLTALEQAIARDQHQTVEYDPPGMGDGIWRAHVRPMARVGGGALLMLEDRTEARRAEQARADFLANASHELRTPLTSLAGFIETMRGPARDDKESWDRFLDIMFEQTERMRRLIADLLSLSRIEFSEHRPPQDAHDLASIVAKATQALVPIALERNIALTFNAPGGEALVIADADEMTQAIQNLITNAVKYSPDGGHVAVELGSAPTLDDAKAMAGRRWQNGARMTILEAPRNEAVAAFYLRVTDEGPGIAREHLPRLGQRFYRVDASRGGKITGTGLGLAIVKHVMTRHRGGFVVETVSGEGSGSGFGFWLPVADLPPAES